MENSILKYLLLAIITYAVTTLIVLVLNRTIDFFIKRKSKGIQSDPTNFIFLRNSIDYILFSIATIWILYQIPYFKNLGAALFAGAGILAAAIGFASQKAFSNIIGGLFILMFRPFSVGDIIEISNGRRGVVEEITLRHTIIRDFEFRRLIVPNGTIGDETILNSTITDNKIRKFIELGISYDSDINKAMDIMRKVIIAHPFCIDNRTQEDIDKGIPEVDIIVMELGDFAVTLRAFAWAKNFDDAFRLRSDCLKNIKEAFDKNDIEIPFPYRTIVYKKDIESNKQEA